MARWIERMGNCWQYFIQGGLWEVVRGGGFRLGLWRRVYRGGGSAGGISVVKYLSSQSLLGTGRWLRRLLHVWLRREVLEQEAEERSSFGWLKLESWMVGW